MLRCRRWKYAEKWKVFSYFSAESISRHQIKVTQSRARGFEWFINSQGVNDKNKRKAHKSCAIDSRNSAFAAIKAFEACGDGAYRCSHVQVVDI